MLFALLIVLVSNVMTTADNTDIANIRGFYQEPKDSLDVVLMGPSELYAGYAPTLAWQEYGYTSYNFSVGGIQGNLYPSVLIEALKRQKPKLVVFNVSGFYWGDWAFEDKAAMHKWIDHMPWSANKIETIKTQVPEEQQTQYFFKLLKYHGNWKHPKACLKAAAVNLVMGLKGYSNLKGICTKTFYNDGSAVSEPAMEYKFSDRARRYFADLLKCCKERGVKNALFIAFPHQRPTEHPEVLTEMEDMVQESGYDFMNFDKNYDSIGITDETDFSDGEHLNMYGMEKFTHYLGGYINDNYSVHSTYSDKIKSRWNKCTDTTNDILLQCKEDLENGIRRGYFEFSVYRKPRIQ